MRSCGSARKRGSTPGCDRPGRRQAVGKLSMVALLLAACSTASRLPDVEPGAGSAPGLGSSFNVSVGADSVRLELHITNVTSDPMVLEFHDGQRYDFAVALTDGTVVWRWSQDRMFPQAVGSEMLAAGESRRYAAAWQAGRDGDYVAGAWLTASNYPVELRTVFRLPAGAEIRQ
jgi:hypothetical protein